MGVRISAWGKPGLPSSDGALPDSACHRCVAHVGVIAFVPGPRAHREGPPQSSGGDSRARGLWQSAATLQPQPPQLTRSRRQTVARPRKWILRQVGAPELRSCRGSSKGRLQGQNSFGVTAGGCCRVATTLSPKISSFGPSLAYGSARFQGTLRLFFRAASSVLDNPQGGA